MVLCGGKKLKVLHAYLLHRQQTASATEALTFASAHMQLASNAFFLFGSQVYQNCLQSARIALCTNVWAIPGAVPEAPNFELYDDAQHQAHLAVEMAEKYALNVAPATVPEVAGRAAQSDVQADLAACKVAFVAPGSAVIALATGKLLQLLLQVCHGSCNTTMH